MVSIIVVASIRRALRLITGMPLRERSSGSAGLPALFVYCRPAVDSEGLGAAAGIPPKAAQLPMARGILGPVTELGHDVALGLPSNMSKPPCRRAVDDALDAQDREGCSPATMRSISAAACRGVSSERRIPEQLDVVLVEEAGQRIAAPPRAFRTRGFAMLSPLHAPSAIHSSVGFAVVRPGIHTPVGRP